ncbi:hypothetical protein WJX73_009044 [Symbiochloris irregularis]|uniref:CRAL-TRIO domain-containing protein n=1 Tax=Symbiochloris irregularis TaxID=706552 RepID=A0AAW1PYT9_9CHLO
MTEALDLVIKSRHNADGERIVQNVLLKAEKDANFLNPVSAVWRFLGPGNRGNGQFRDAVLLLGSDSLEVYLTAMDTGDEESSTGGPAKRVMKLPATVVHLPGRILSKAKNSALSHTGSERIVLPDANEPDTAVEEVVEGHIFSIGVAYGQLLRVRCSDATITLWYHPNTIAKARLSKNPEAKALRFSFALPDREEAAGVLRKLETSMERYAQAVLFLGRRMPFHNLIQMTNVTQTLGKGSPETVILQAPSWETTALLSPEWSSSYGHKDLSICLHLSTPFGGAAAYITKATLQKYKQGNDSRFFVGAQVASVMAAQTSVIQKKSFVDSSVSRASLKPSSSALSASGEEGDEDSWQPDSEDSDDTSSVMGSAASRLWSKGTSSGIGKGSWQIRIHCHARVGKPASQAQNDSAGVSGRTEASSTSAASSSGRIDLKRLWLPILLAIVALTGATAQRSADRGAASAQGQHMRSQWSIMFIKAEFTQDDWQDSGESTEVSASSHATSDEQNEEGEEEKQTLAQKFGLTDDGWQRFMVGFHQDEAAASKAAAANKVWRSSNDLPQDFSSEPQPNYQEIKTWFRHGVMCLTKEGQPVWLMKVGDMKQGWKDYKASSLKDYDINRHIAFCMDWMYNHIDTRDLPNGRSLWLIDLKGMGMTDMGSDAFNFGKNLAIMIGQNFPERVSRIFVVHVPGFFSLLWRIVEPMLSPNTRRKIRLLRSQNDMLREMKEEMDEADIPIEYGGQCRGDLYDMPKEVELLERVKSLNSK